MSANDGVGSVVARPRVPAWRGRWTPAAAGCSRFAKVAPTAMLSTAPKCRSAMACLRDRSASVESVVRRAVRQDVTTLLDLVLGLRGLDRLPLHVRRLARAA